MNLKCRNNNRNFSFFRMLPALAVIFVCLSVASCAPVKVNGGQVIRELPPRPMPSDAVDMVSSPVELDVPASVAEPEPAKIPVVAEAPPAPSRLVRVLVLPDSSRVDSRLGVYADKLKNWKLLEEQIVSLGLEDRRPEAWSACRADLEDIFAGYSRLMELVLKQSTPSDKLDPVDFDLWGVYYRDMAFLEGDCDRVFKDGASLVKGWLDRFSSQAREEAEAAVERYADGGKYEEAILAYNNLLSSYPGRLLSVAARRAYAMALLKTGRLSEAVDALQDSVQQLSPSPEQRSLMRLIADILLSLGRVDEAKDYYQKLADFYNSRKGDDVWVKDQLSVLSRADLSSGAYVMYQEVMRYNLSFDGRKVPDGMEKMVRQMEEQFPSSPFTIRARENLREVLDSARGWFEGRMAAVDRLVEAGDFDRARGVVDALLSRNLSAATMEMVQHTREEIDRAEKAEVEKQQHLLQQTRESQWQEAEKLLDQRDYDGAIKVYHLLYDTEYDQKARTKVVMASDQAASDLRRRAANIFVKARRSGDYDSKRKYFVDSWKLLASILVKYPDSTLLDKVRQNQAILSGQIKKLDPDLFASLNNPPGAGGSSEDSAPSGPAASGAAVSDELNVSVP